MMNEIEAETVKVAIEDLFDRGSFNICEIDKIIKITGVRPLGRVYNCWSAMHCIDYGKMSAGHKKWLFDSVLETFAQKPTFDMAQIEAAITPGAKGQRYAEERILS